MAIICIKNYWYWGWFFKELFENITGSILVPLFLVVERNYFPSLLLSVWTAIFIMLQSPKFWIYPNLCMHVILTWCNHYCQDIQRWTAAAAAGLFRLQEFFHREQQLKEEKRVINNHAEKLKASLKV